MSWHWWGKGKKRVKKSSLKGKPGKAEEGDGAPTSKGQKGKKVLKQIKQPQSGKDRAYGHLSNEIWYGFVQKQCALNPIVYDVYGQFLSLDRFTMVYHSFCYPSKNCRMRSKNDTVVLVLAVYRFLSIVEVPGFVCHLKQLASKSKAKEPRRGKDFPSRKDIWKKLCVSPKKETVAELMWVKQTIPQITIFIGSINYSQMFGMALFYPHYVNLMYQ